MSCSSDDGEDLSSVSSDSLSVRSFSEDESASLFSTSSGSEHSESDTHRCPSDGSNSSTLTEDAEETESDLDDYVRWKHKSHTVFIARFGEEQNGQNFAE